MSLVAKATQAFYEWDWFLRGYYHYDFPIQIEPPFISGSYLPLNTEQPKIDDGKVPSIFSQLKNTFSKKEEQEEKEYTRTPKAEKYGVQLRGLKIQLDYSEPIAIKSAKEFLKFILFYIVV